MAVNELISIVDRCYNLVELHVAVNELITIVDRLQTGRAKVWQ